MDLVNAIEGFTEIGCWLNLMIKWVTTPIKKGLVEEVIVTYNHQPYDGDLLSPLLFGGFVWVTLRLQWNIKFSP